MAEDGTNTQAQRMPQGKPAPEGAAITPLDTTTGAATAIEGSMDRPGTEAEVAARSRTEDA